MIKKFECDYTQFIDKSTLLFGESGSGKSSIIKDILFYLRGHIHQIIVFSPTDRQNKTYSRGLVPLPCIHYNISPDVLNNIWERQMALSQLYTKVNNLSTLESLYKKSCELPGVDLSLYVKGVDNIKKILSDYKQEINKSNMDHNQILSNLNIKEQECNNLLMSIYKKCIEMNRNKLTDLTTDEKYTLRYLNINPKIVVLFDDCTDILKQLSNDHTLHKMFNQGRWMHMTTIFACHTDKALPPELKKNAFLTIFTGPKCASSYFTRTSNSFEKEDIKKAQEVIKQVFVESAKYQKLVWTRESCTYYKYTATMRNEFSFCAGIVVDYCDKIKTSENGNFVNRYSAEFTID